MKDRRNRKETSRVGKTQAVCAVEGQDRKRKRPQSVHEKLWVLAVCDNMKIVDVPEEGRRRFV